MVLEARANPDARDSFGQTPLMMAAKQAEGTKLHSIAQQSWEIFDFIPLGTGRPLAPCKPMHWL